ncbi:hypothetical protein [Undibacterium sp. WLX3042]|uniref:hypothetical protein n=1 Tax=Undibacterium sp. WLX3042 TaxID=3412686 RepID=UPI003C2CF211
MTRSDLTTPVPAHRQFFARLHQSVWRKMADVQPAGWCRCCLIGVRSGIVMLLARYQNLSVSIEFTHPLIIVCDGITVDMVKLEAWKTRFNLP